jgi:pSer/pThr/pTyr-binding forkhead associated (FHA) protein
MAEQGNSPRIWVNESGQAPHSAALKEGRTLVGRGEHCEVRIEDDAVSTDHLEITRRGSTLLATDLDSRNGTLLNGDPLEGTRRLRNGDVLVAGGARLEVAVPPQVRHDSTVAAPRSSPELTPEERETASVLVRPYRAPDVRAGRPATRAELAAALHVSERTAQRRLDGLARKLGVPSDAGRERPRLIAERVLELGLDRA